MEEKDAVQFTVSGKMTKAGMDVVETSPQLKRGGSLRVKRGGSFRGEWRIIVGIVMCPQRSRRPLIILGLTLINSHNTTDNKKVNMDTETVLGFFDFFSLINASFIESDHFSLLT